MIPILLLLVNRLTAMLLSDSSNLIKVDSFLAQTDKLSSSAKFWIQPFSIKWNKSLTEILEKINSIMEPWSTPEIVSNNLLW